MEYAVWAVDPDRVKRGQLEVLSCTAIPRDADIGTWTMTVVDDELSRRVEDGWRVIILDDTGFTMSGPVLSYGGYVVDKSLTFSGEDDLFHVASRDTYPDPRKPAEQQTDAAYWKKSGPAGTLLDELIYRNVGRGGIPERAVDRLFMDGAYSGVGLGSTVSVNTRYKNVLETSRDLARAGGVTFWAVQPEDSTSIVVRFREPRDMSRRVRFALGDGGGLTGGSWSVTAPTVTSVLVAGQGQGAARTIKEHVQSSGDWGFRVEQFQDRRDTDDPKELEQAGTDTLAEGAAGASAVVEVSEVPGLIYGIDFQLGDTVLVDFGRAQITEPVRAVELTYDGFGRTAKLTLGDHAQDEDQDPAWVKHVRGIGKRLRGLETI